MIKKKRADNTNTYDYVVKDLGLPIDVVEPDDNDAIIWAGGANRIFRITASGHQTINLTSLGGFALGSGEEVRKIRVVNDVVWVGTGARIIQIKGTQASVFKVLDSSSGGSGDFAVDNKYVYTSQGEKIDIQLKTATSFIPPQPPATDPQLFMEYMAMMGEFKASDGLEVSADPLDQYIYTLTPSQKLLRVKKSL
jgi:hypothetical protein